MDFYRKHARQIEHLSDLLLTRAELFMAEQGAPTLPPAVHAELMQPLDAGDLPEVPVDTLRGRYGADWIIRAAIDNDLPDERGNSWYRIQLYSFGATMILQDTTVPFDVKNKLVPIKSQETSRIFHNH